jgi:hypothetical protein
MRRTPSDFFQRVQSDWRCGRTLLRAAVVYALAQALFLAGPSTALAKSNKLVGVVFDDSGSMEGRTNLPVFGIQMLAASLTRSDQLYGMTFKQFLAANGGSGVVDPAILQNPARLRNFMTRFPLTDLNAQQAAINTIKGWAKQPSVGTPFMPLMVMLSFLIQSATPDDDVHLFIFTDGEFNDPPPSLAALEQALQALKQNSNAKSLNVHFLAFVASDSDEQKIKGQGIASALDKTINVNKTQGFENVFYARDFSRLRKQMVDIIARISETEPEDAQLKSIVKRAGSRITMNAPVTITKMVVISTAPDARDFPRIQTLPPNVPTSTELIAEMENRDSQAKLRGTDGRLWKAKITHLEPYPALPANKEFSIEFDRQLTDQTTLLFRTDMTIEWSVFDANGKEVAAAPDGTITLSAEQDYEVRAHIEDNGSGQKGPASFQNLPSETEFTMLQRDSSGRAQRNRMQIDKPNDRATSKLRYNEARTDEVSVSITMPGFVTARSRAIKINVVRNNVDITLTPKPLVQCPNCSASMVELKLAASAPWTAAMAVTARAVARDSGRDGKLAFSLADPLPTGIRVRIPSSNTILEGTKTEFEMPLNAANGTELIFEVDGSFLSTFPAGYKAKLLAKAVTPLVGSAAAAFDIHPKHEDAQLVFAGTTDGATGDTPFRVKPDGLDGNAGFFVRVLRRSGPPGPTDFDVKINGLAADVVPQRAPQDDIALVKPRPGIWCNCFVRSGRYEIDARFKNANGQEAVLTGAMFIESVTLWERIVICRWLIAAIIAAAYFLAGLYRFVTNYRFPRRSRLLVYPPGKRIEGVPRRLARRPWPLIKPFVLPFRRWDEQSRVEGLSLEAGPGSVRILPKGGGGYEHIRRGVEARPISHYFQDGSKEPLELFWGERLEELSGERRTFEFLESTDQI